MKRDFYFSLPLVLAVALGAMVRPAKGQETNAIGAETLTLDAAIRLAQTNNPGLRVLAAGVAVARGELTTARTWENPELAITPGFDHTREPADTQFHANFDLQQTFEWPGKRALRQALAERNVAAQQLALAGFRSQLAIQVRRLYLSVLAAREVVALGEKRLNLADSFLTVAQKKVEAGFAPEFEATKAEVEVVAAQKALRAAQAKSSLARIALNTCLGRAPEEAAPR